MLYSTRTPSFPENLQSYAPWVAAHGLYALYGECQCGCGNAVSVAARSSRDRGNKKGCPVRFYGNHNVPGRCFAPSGLLVPPGAALIPLAREMVAIVDAVDFEWLMQWRWRAHKGNTATYVIRRIGGRVVFMHRVILDVTDPAVLVDHKNRNGLDNRRDNIRIATSADNMHNRIASSNNTSGYKGVQWDKRKGRWIARIGIGNKRKHIGHFASADDAALAYDQMARELHGEFARLNFPDKPPTEIPSSNRPKKNGPNNNNKCGYRGVYWDNHAKKWHAEIRCDGKRESLGYYRDVLQAAFAYDAAAKRLHGASAFLNFPDHGVNP